MNFRILQNNFWKVVLIYILFGVYPSGDWQYFHRQISAKAALFLELEQIFASM